MTDDIDAFLDRFRAAWDAGDADAFGALFTMDATYVIFMGEALRGRAEIARNHAEVFTRWQKDTRMVVRVIGVERVANEVWSVLTIGGVGREAPVAFDKFQTYTLVRDEAGLRCAAFQNTSMSDRAMRHYAEQGRD